MVIDELLGEVATLYKMLIADDEYFIRYGLEHIIQWEEYGIEICGSVSNGLEALEVFRQEEPDIVITDVKMPEMTGLELLKEIRQLNPNTKVIVISGHNDFEYVKETLAYGVENYILKPINEDELSQTVLNALDKIEKEKESRDQRWKSNNYIVENVFNRLITNSIAVKEVEERLDFFEVDMSCERYVVGVIGIINELEGYNRIEKQGILNFLKNRLSKYKTHIFYDLSGKIVFISCLNSEESYDQLEDATKRLITGLNDDYKLDVFLTIGSEVQGLENIHESYATALSLQEYIYIYSENTQVSYKKIASVKKRLDDLFDINIDLFKEHLKLGNKHEVELFFFEVKQNALSSEGSNINYVRSFLIELVAVLINVIKEKALWKGKEVIYPDKLYEKLFGEGNLRSTITWLKDISIRIVESIVDEKSKPATLQGQVIDYIHQNYDKNISLKIIASEFYVNSSYLGQTFKKETGKLFSTYLNELRIEKAKKLMDETHMKASLIANEVGYSDANYFYKVFKKYTGVYPSEYGGE